MAQTGVPFGEIESVKDWIGIEEPIDRPPNEHPKRPIEGFRCQRSEVSGRRLWGLFRERFVDPDAFFARHFVANYCPLVFMEQSARNRTPDKLPASERGRLDEICDRHLKAVLEVLRPTHVVGVGAYAEKCLTASSRKQAAMQRSLASCTQAPPRRPPTKTGLEPPPNSYGKPASGNPQPPPQGVSATIPSHAICEEVDCTGDASSIRCFREVPE